VSISFAKIIIAGGRDFKEYERLERWLDRNIPEPFELICGGAQGADNMGRMYATKKEYPIQVLPAEWDKYGKSAGYRRNVDMAKIADGLIAVWDGKSKGTQHMIQIMEDLDKPVTVLRY